MLIADIGSVCLQHTAYENKASVLFVGARIARSKTTCLLFEDGSTRVEAVQA